MHFLGLLILIGSCLIASVLAIKAKKATSISSQPIFLATNNNVLFSERRVLERRKDYALNKFLSIDCNRRADDIVIELAAIQFDTIESLRHVNS